MSGAGEQLDRDFAEIENWAAALRLALESWAATLEANVEAWALTVELSGAAAAAVTAHEADADPHPQYLTSAEGGYEFAQTPAATTWNIPHALGRKPAIQCSDSAGNPLYGKIIHTDVNNAQVVFGTPHEGTAICA